MLKDPGQRLKTRRMGRTAAMFYALVLGLLPLVLAGCASARYGWLQRDPAVTRMFDNNAVPDDYSYYTIGRSGLPYAIIGIKPRYHLIADHWEPVVPNTASFAHKVDGIWIPQVWDRLETAQGAWIRDSEGNKIGIWYSRYANTVIKVKPGHRVQIFSPFTPTSEVDLGQ